MENAQRSDLPHTCSSLAGCLLNAQGKLHKMFCSRNLNRKALPMLDLHPQREEFIASMLVIVPDTNALMSHNFAGHLAELRNLRRDLKPLLAELVKMERSYQRIQDLKKARSALKDAYRLLGTLLPEPRSEPPTDAEIATAVESKFLEWLTTNSGELLPIPYSDIRLKTLVERSVARQAPFTGGEEGEKGFRDAILLESVREYAQRNPGDEVYLISADKALRRAVTELSLNNLNVKESISLLISELDLTRTFAPEIAATLVEQAGQVFLTNVLGKTTVPIVRQFISEWRKVEADDWKPPTGEAWQSAFDEKVSSEAPEFRQITESERGHVLHWRSPVIFSNTYFPMVEVYFKPQVEARLVHRRLDVFWRCLLDENNAIIEPEIEEIAYRGATSEPAFYTPPSSVSASLFTSGTTPYASGSYAGLSGISGFNPPPSGLVT
jgi:hypothetical protein